MKAIKRVVSLVMGRVTPITEHAEVLSSVEMDHLFGGKPAEIVSSQTYWWIEENQVLNDPLFAVNLPIE